MLKKISKIHILYLGIFIRIAYFLKERSLWGDEFWVIEKVKMPFFKTIIAYINDVHPPLMAIIYKINHTRLFPFLAGIATFYLFSKLTKNRLALFIFAVSPYFLQLGGELRGYGFLALFSVLVLLGRKWAVPLALMTEHYAWFLLLVCFSWYFVPFLASSGLLILHQLSTEQVFSANRGFEYSYLTIAKKISGLLIQFGGGVQYSFLTSVQAIKVFKSHLLILYMLPSVFILWARDKKYLKLFFLPILILLCFYPIRLNARYLPFVGISYILLICEGFEKVKKHTICKLIMILFIYMNLSSLCYLFTTNYDPYHREDYIKASKYIEENIQENDGLIGCVSQIEYYTKKKYNNSGKIIYEVYIGNPDPKINEYHWKTQSKKYGIPEITQISELVWVIKYNKEEK